MTNWSINLAVVNSLRSKLVNKKVKGVFWPVVKSLRGVWAFFPKILEIIRATHGAQKMQFFLTGDHDKVSNYGVRWVYKFGVLKHWNLAEILSKKDTGKQWGGWLMA